MKLFKKRAGKKNGDRSEAPASSSTTFTSEQLDESLASFQKKPSTAPRRPPSSQPLDTTDTTWHASSKSAPTTSPRQTNDDAFATFNPFDLDKHPAHGDDAHHGNDDDNPSSQTLRDILTKLEEHQEQQRLLQHEEDTFFTAETASIVSTSAHTTSSTPVDLDAILDMYDIKLMCAQVVDCMTMAPNSPSIQRDGAEALYRLAVSLLNEFEEGDGEQSQPLDDSVTSTGVEAILQAMEDFPDEESLQEKACNALEYLTYWKVNQEIILTRGRVEEILVAMEEFESNLQLQVSAMGILQKLATHPHALEDKTTSKQLTHAIPLVLELMKNYRENEDIYVQGCGLLAAITTNNTTSQQLLCKDQIGIRIVIEAMHKFSKSSNLKIQLHAMETLEHVASHPSPECKGKIVLQGGLERILDALQRNNIVSTSISSYEDEIEREPSSDAQKQKSTDVSTLIMVSALRTLANIAHVSNGASSVSDEVRKKMAKSVKIILNVLRQHPRNLRVQIAGFAALKMLAGSHTELLCSSGGISTILVAMLEHTIDGELQEQACATLNNLLSSPYAGENSLDLVYSIATEDGLTTIFRSVRMHQANQAVQEAAFGVLYYLSCNRDIPASQKRQMCLEENIFVLLATLNQMLDSELLCQKACGLILNLSFFAPISQDVMASVGGIHIILAAMRRHGLNVQVQEFGVGILSGLCLDDKNHAEFVNEEGISTVLAAMMIHPEQASIQACCCDLLVNLACSDPSYRHAIIDGNGLMVVNDAMKRHRSHRGVQSCGSELLKVLQ